MSALRVLVIAALYLIVNAFAFTVVSAGAHFTNTSNSEFKWLVVPVTMGGLCVLRPRVPRIVDPTGECNWVDAAGFGGVSLVALAFAIVSLVHLSVGATALVGALGFGVGASMFLGAVLVRSRVLDRETIQREAIN